MRVHVVVPAGFDDPGQPSGGNVYDRRVCAGLAEAGWEVLVATVAAAWPVPGSGALADLARIVSSRNTTSKRQGRFPASCRALASALAE